VTLDLAVLGISVSNARKVGTDQYARRLARRALKEAKGDGGEEVDDA
jgi:hypothetical protein